MPREDDQQIGDGTILLRAVHPSQVKTDESGNQKAQSWAFFDDRREVSAYIEAEITLERFRAVFPSFRVARFSAGDARTCKNVICREPDDMGEGSHVVICPVEGKSGGQFRKDAKRLAARAQILPE